MEYINNINNENNDSCYLITACIKHFQKDVDNCHELTILRCLIDNFASKEDKEHFYAMAPIIVNCINNEEKVSMLYEYIYSNIIEYCINQIKIGEYDNAYFRYKSCFLALEEILAKPLLQKEFTKIYKKIIE